MISFLKDENHEEKTGLSDLILFIIIIALGVGGYLYFGHAESATLEEFAKADKLFKERKFEEAYEAYSALMEDASWTTDELDAVLYWNNKVLDVIIEPPEKIAPIDSVDSHWSIFAKLDSTFKKDSITFIRTFTMPEQVAFLRYDQWHTLEVWDSVHTIYKDQERLYSAGTQLWASKESAWTSADSARFIQVVDSIGTGHLLDSIDQATIESWITLKQTMLPDSTENN